MKITKICASLLGALAISAAFSSCIKDNSDPRGSSIPYGAEGMLVYSVADDDTIANTDVNIDFTYYVNTGVSTTGGVADITFSNLKLGDGLSFNELKFENLSWKFDYLSAWIKIAESTATPTEGTTLPFNAFIFDFMERSVAIGSQYLSFPLIKVSFMALGRQYYIMPKTVVNLGDTQVTNTLTGDVYNQSLTEQAIYCIYFDVAKKLATIDICGAKFDSSMPAMNMRFPDIPYTYDRNGMLVLEQKDPITPLIVKDIFNFSATGTPYEQFPISNILGQTDAANNMRLTFTCTLALDKDNPDMKVPYVTNVVCSTPTNNTSNQ